MPRDFFRCAGSSNYDAGGFPASGFVSMRKAPLRIQHLIVMKIGPLRRFSFDIIVFGLSDPP